MLIPYLGNKEKFSNFIIPHIPEDISTYVEPFGGSMGIFFSLDLNRFKNIKFIYNDINYLNSNLFNNLKNNKDFINIIKSTIVDKSVYDKALEDIKIKYDAISDAINWLIVLTCSAPNKIGIDSWRGDTEFEIFKLKWKAYEKSINNISEILNLDYKDIIKKYDSYSTFFYLDPPYMCREDYYINHNFNVDSHFELASCLRNIKGRFLLSYYYFNEMEELYPNCRFESKPTIMGTEWIIMNY